MGAFPVISDLRVESSGHQYQILPWYPVKEVSGARMYTVDVYFFCWLGSLIEPLHMIGPEQPLAASLQRLILARVALEGFDPREPLASGFPRSAVAANELLGVINDIVPPVGAQVPENVLGAPIDRWQVDRIKALCHALTSGLRDEAQRSYILKVEDQRCLSSHSLIDRIEDCYPKDVWAVISDDAKRELEESGRCLALERYTGAGFHALRGVECVIRQYIVKLTGSLPRKRDWGFYIQTLKDNGADANLIAVLDNIRTLDRNPLMHPEDWLEIDDAVGVFNITQTAIVRLVAGIKRCP